jgi:UDP-N-acetyl-D-mannosaminuronic acid dehydrogenase
VQTDARFPTNRKICVVGLGYTGLPTAAILASRGYDVHGVDVSPSVIETINSGRAHIVEPELDILVRAAVQTGKLQAHDKPQESDIFVLCVPTPCTREHQPNLDYVYEATRSICPYVRQGNLVILESTVPPGATESIAAILQEETGLSLDDLHVAHAPERVLPGKIVREVVENDRIIGGVDEASTEACATFYQTFVSGKLHLTHSRTAETAKLVENAYRDVNIAFANEISFVSDALDLDVWELIDLANRHPRVNILSPGPGVGGHCIAIDPWFLVAKAPDSTKLIRAARELNDSKPDYVIQRVLRRAERFKDPRIACLGLAYKPNIDDLRESPAVKVARGLLAANAGDVRIVEPYIGQHDEFALSTVEEAVSDADIVVFLVAHDPFKKIPRKALAEKVIIDTCGVLGRP